MKKIIMTIAGVFAMASSTLLTSCDFLDVDDYFQATFKEDSIFHSKQNAEGYLWNTPTDFPDPGAIWNNSWTPGQSASDELAVKPQNNNFWGTRFSVGNIDEITLPNWDQWKKMYTVIMRCNRMLNNVNQVVDMTDKDRRQYIAYVHFMRGWAYYHLLMNWGPLLIVGDEVMLTDQDAEYYNRERATFDESIDYIVNEFGESLKGINDPRQQSMTFFARPTKGAALALIARLRLIQASPTFNGGDAARRAFSGWKRQSDGADYINQTYDPTRWAVAAAAAKQVIDMNYYELHTVAADPAFPYPLTHVDASLVNTPYPDGVGGIDPLHSFADMFNGETVARVNREFIWAHENSSNVTTATRYSYPAGGSMQGWAGIGVPQRVVDAFLMADGLPIDESPLYNPDLKELTQAATNLSTYVLRSGVPMMYANREARFYASIGFPGRLWEMNTASAKTELTNLQFWYDASDNIGGKAGSSNNTDQQSVTGYVPVKFVHPDDSWADASGVMRVTKAFPTIRYAEVLLIFAEAMNQISGTPTVEVHGLDGQKVEVTISRDTELMARYFNRIRYRVGLPGVSEEKLASVTEFDKVVRNERQIELFNEGHRYFDTRRWGTFIDEDANTSNWQGLDVNRDRDNSNSNEGFWNIVNINEQNIRNRIANPRMIFLPLHHNELVKAPKMDQNWGWER